MIKNLKSALIIGSGVAGLASSIRLAQKGYQVTVLESNSYLGGKLSQIDDNGFRFDAGPSLFTMPWLVDDLFLLCGKNPRDYFNYQKLNDTCHYFWQDGTTLTAYGDKNELVDEIALKLNETKDSLENYIAKANLYYQTTNHVFLERSLHDWKNYLRLDTFKSALKLPQLGLFKTLHQQNQSFFQNPKTIQFFDRYATYNGSNPYQTPGTMMVIPHLEISQGAFFPIGGMVAITNSLVKLAQEMGVEFVLNTKVDQILIVDNIAKGVITKSKDYWADIVVTNADMVATYKNLIPDYIPKPEKLLSQPKSSSALIFYWGIRNQYPNLGLHNIFFSQNYEHEFHTIFENKSIPDDPTIYVNISSKLKPDDAPDGCENWFVMINTPNNSGQDWDLMISNARNAIAKKLSKILKRDIASDVVSEQILDPRSIQSKTSSWQGALYGNSSNNRYAAFQRHPYYSKQIKNLYFCGGSVHPGGGIPLSLLSAKILGEIIK